MPATSTKDFTVHFYRGHIGPADNDGTGFKTKLLTLASGNELLDEAKKHGLRLAGTTGSYLFIELKKYRDEAPHIGKPSGGEREIVMAADEHVIEKAYGLYCTTLNILCLQLTNHFRSPGEIANIFSRRGTLTTHFSSILNTDPTGRLTQKQHDIKSIECSVVLPSGRAQSPSDDWSKAALVLSDGAPGRLHFTITGDMRGTTKHPLAPSTVQKVLRGAADGFLAKAKAIPSTGEAIDLLNDRLSDKISPTMSGKYPMSGSVQSELISAFADNAAALNVYKP